MLYSVIEKKLTEEAGKEMGVIAELRETVDWLALRLADIGRPATREEILTWIIKAGIERVRQNVEAIAR